MDLVKTCITWSIWKGNHVVTKLKYELVYHKALVMLNDLHPVQMVKVIQEQLKCQLFLEQK